MVTKGSFPTTTGDDHWPRPERTVSTSVENRSTITENSDTHRDTRDQGTTEPSRKSLRIDGYTILKVFVTTVFLNPLLTVLLSEVSREVTMLRNVNIDFLVVGLFASVVKPGDGSGHHTVTGDCVRDKLTMSVPFLRVRNQRRVSVGSSP